MNIVEVLEWLEEGQNEDLVSGVYPVPAVLKEAIALAEGAEKQAKVDELRSAILAGNAEAEGLDATNPERQRMMEAWCTSDDPARTADPKTSFQCAWCKPHR